MTTGTSTARSWTPASPPRPQPCEVPPRTSQDVALEVVGDVDLSTAAALEDRLERAGQATGGTVVVDLSRVVFIDCHGVDVLIAARTRLGSRLVLRAPAPVVTRLLELTGTAHHFEDPSTGDGTPADGDRPVPGSTPWSQEVAGAMTAAVEHLQLEHPAQAWLATRVEGDHHVIAAAAGPWAGELPAGTELPWRRPLGQADDLADTAWPVTDAAELLGAGAGTGRPLAVAASTGVLLLAGGEVAGTVCGFTSRTTTARPLTAAAPLLRLLGKVLGVTLTTGRDHAVARDLAEIDALTRLRNRRGWKEALTRESARTARYGTDAGIIAIDLDALKATNDTYGHHAGDALLVATAEALRRTCRPSDVLARLGGDEFAVLAVQADPAALTALTTRIIDDLAAARIPASVAAAPHEPTTTLENTWAEADRAMCAVKALRRAQTTAVPPGDEDAPATTVLSFYDTEGLLPTSPPRSGEEQDRSSTASRLDFIHRARQAGLSPTQIRGALALRHSPATPSPPARP